MTDEVLAAQGADDAKLLNLVRAGDSGAFVVLRQRHEQAARRLARELVGSAAEVDDLIAQTFAHVLDVTSHGGGPTDAFRPYLLTALRLACDDDGLRAGGSDAGKETSLMAAAFFALPERWIAVLWHTEIESASPADVAPLLGLGPDAVAALRRRARDGLLQTCLRLHASRVGRPECKPVAEQLGAFVERPGAGAGERAGDRAPQPVRRLPGAVRRAGRREPGAPHIGSAGHLGRGGGRVPVRRAARHGCSLGRSGHRHRHHGTHLGR